MLTVADGFRPFRDAAQPAFIGLYLKSIDEIVGQRPTEDSGDPTVLNLEGPGDAAPKLWLSHFRHIRDMAASSNGRWVMFVDRSRHGATQEQGGDVYLVEAGGDDATPLLRATTGKASYSSPSPWP